MARVWAVAGCDGGVCFGDGPMDGDGDGEGETSTDGDGVAEGAATGSTVTGVSTAAAAFCC